MGFGLGVLRLAPAAFWAATPREIGAAAKSLSGRSARPAAPGLGDLAALMALHPDRTEGP